MSYYGTETATQCRHCGAPAEEGDTCAKCEELFHPRPKVERPLPPTAKVEDELDTKLTPTRSTMRAPVPGYKLLIAGFLIWVSVGSSDSACMMSSAMPLPSPS